MKRLLLFLLATGAIVVFIINNLSAQNIHSYAYKDFNGIEAGKQVHVNVIQSEDYSIEVQGDNTDIADLKVIKKGKTLVFYYEQQDYTPKGEITVNIKAPEIYNINLTNGAQCNIIMNIESEDFKGKLSGGSSLKGKLNCEDAEFNTSGGSSIGLEGKAETLTAKGTEKSELNLKDFYVEDVNADLSQSSSLIITAYGTIQANQSDGSGIIYYGNPVINNTDFSGGSSIARGE